MRFLKTIILIVLTLMSLSAGAAKVRLMPHEAEFFAQAGLAVTWLYPLGALQILGAGLAAFSKFRYWGLILIAAGLLISAVVIFMTGNMFFTVVSLIPAALAGLLAMFEKNEAL